MTIEEILSPQHRLAAADYNCKYHSCLHLTHGVD